jgi:ribosomal protein S8
MKTKNNVKIIKKAFEDEGYILKSDYINCHTPLVFICPNGHTHKINWNNWLTGHRCGICYGNNKKTIDFIQKEIEKEGYILKTNSYINSRKYIDLICPKGHSIFIKWNNWQQGQRCSFCYGNSSKINDIVNESFKSEGFILKSNYINSRIPLIFICPNGHIHKITWNKWKSGQRCAKCAYEMEYSKAEKEILKYVQKIYSGIIIENDRTKILNPITGKYLELDIWMPELNKAIEYNGNYWHNNKYQKIKDKIKFDYCKNNNIELLVIDEIKWENKTALPIVKNFIGL